MRWKDFDADLHEELLTEARAAQLPRLDFPIAGSDLDPAAIAIARKNARAAGVEHDIVFTEAHYEAAVPPAAKGTLIFNPPYDERMKAFQLEGVYRRIGAALKQNWGGWTCHIFTGAFAEAAAFGLRPSRKLRLFNGPIECRLLHYDLFDRRAVAVQTPKVAAARTSSPVASPVALLEHGEVDVAPRSLQSSTSNPTDERLEEPNLDGPDLDGPDLDGPDLDGPDLDGPDFDGPDLDEADEFDDELAVAATLPSAGRRNWHDQAREFRNRLVRMAKHWKKWAKRQGVTCFRLYDRDVPEIPLAIDWYEGRLQIAEYIRPHDRTDIEHKTWLKNMIQTAAEALEVKPELVAIKHRQRQSGPSQYERTAEERELLTVHEAGHQFLVNLSDYLDTGLFLDHRITRSMVERNARGKRFLNLFGYTGAFTVYAAAGGATATTTVDLSNTYIDWARRNMKLNGFTEARHQFVREDALAFLGDLPTRASRCSTWPWSIRRRFPTASRRPTCGTCSATTCCCSTW